MRRWEIRLPFKRALNRAPQSPNTANGNMAEDLYPRASQNQG
jgi:hypothetical protein